MKANAALKQKDMAWEYKISKQAVSDILKQEKMWITIETGSTSAKKMRSRKPAFIEIDDAMRLWVDHVLIRGDINLNDSIIMERDVP